MTVKLLMTQKTVNQSHREYRSHRSSLSNLMNRWFCVAEHSYRWHTRWMFVFMSVTLLAAIGLNRLVWSSVDAHEYSIQNKSFHEFETSRLNRDCSRR